MKIYVKRGSLVLVAVCDVHGHKCTKARSLEEHRPDWRASAGQGRPVGFLVAWLSHASDAVCPNAWSHKWDVEVSLEERTEQREKFEAMDGSRCITKYERDRRAGEGPEPEVQP